MPPPLYSQEVRWTNMFGGANKPQHGRVWALKSQCAARTASVNILRYGISLLERQPPMHALLAHFCVKIANVWVPTPSLWPVLQPKHFVCVLLRKWSNSLKTCRFLMNRELMIGSKPRTNPSERYFWLRSMPLFETIVHMVYAKMTGRRYRRVFVYSKHANFEKVMLVSQKRFVVIPEAGLLIF